MGNFIPNFHSIPSYLDKNQLGKNLPFQIFIPFRLKSQLGMVFKPANLRPKPPRPTVLKLPSLLVQKRDDKHRCGCRVCAITTVCGCGFHGWPHVKPTATDDSDWTDTTHAYVLSSSVPTCRPATQLVCDMSLSYPM